MLGGIISLREENEALRRTHQKLLKLLKEKPTDDSVG